MVTHKILHFPKGEENNFIFIGTRDSGNRLLFIPLFTNLLIFYIDHLLYARYSSRHCNIIVNKI